VSRRPRPRALGVKQVAIEQQRLARLVPSRGIDRGQDRIRKSMTLVGTGRQHRSLTDCSGDDLWRIWHLLERIEAGVVKLVAGHTGVLYQYSRGRSETVRWEEVDDPPGSTAAPSLFDTSPAARVTDPPTSWAADHEVRSDTVKLGRQLTDALRVIAQAGEHGTTTFAVAAELSRESGRTARRITDLKQAGLVEETGEEIRVETGRLQRVVRATRAGLAAADRGVDARRTA
jgi:hypothetical protein